MEREKIYLSGNHKITKDALPQLLTHKRYNPLLEYNNSFLLQGRIREINPEVMGRTETRAVVMTPQVQRVLNWGKANKTSKEMGQIPDFTASTDNGNALSIFSGTYG